MGSQREGFAPFDLFDINSELLLPLSMRSRKSTEAGGCIAVVLTHKGALDSISTLSMSAIELTVCVRGEVRRCEGCDGGLLSEEESRVRELRQSESSDNK